MIVKLLTRCLMFCLICIVPECGIAQSDLNHARDWVDSILYRINFDQNIDSKTKSDLADSVFRVCAKKQDICRQIFALSKQATYLDNMGMADSALTQLYLANRMFLNICDSSVLMSVMASLTNIYLSLGELNRVDSVSNIALSVWNPAWKEKESRLAILNNRAIAQATGGSFDTATTTFHRAYLEAVADSNERYVQKALINLGSIKGITGELDSAYFFLSTAANKAKANDDVDSYITLLTNLANLESERGRFSQAIRLLDSAYVLAKSNVNTESLAGVQNARADIFFQKHDFEKAYGYLKDYVKLSKQNLDEERVKAVTEMMEKYESEKKARQIQQLKLENLNATLINERITNTRNRYLYIGAFILIIAVGLWSRLRYVHKSRAAIQREKEISENLLVKESAQAREIEKAYSELKATQEQLVQSAKMASLGELTAGIAHEIQNPLNFVNNFSELNSELIAEMKQEIEKGNTHEVNAIVSMLDENEKKITFHGKRADAIVKAMLQHSRSSSGTKEPTDLNALADEFLRLAYHGLRAKEKTFNTTLKTDFDERIGKIDINPQDIGRVILNLITNAFYAVTEKKKALDALNASTKESTLKDEPGYEPTVSVSTRLRSSDSIERNGDLSRNSGEGRTSVEISIRDNGNGIPKEVRNKIFQPFFTTKPPGQGTGLGLSLSYDIIKAHGGELKIETKEGEFAEFIIWLPV